MIFVTIKRTFSILSIIFFISGCSRSVIQPSKEPLEFLELYLSRASLSTTEFEQYKISPGGVFVECGEVKGGRPIAASQEFKRYESQQFAEIEKQASELLSYLANQPSTFDPPGRLGSLADPGQLTLSISIGKHKKDITTSVNSISEERTVADAKVKKLTQTIRTVVQNEVCGKASFYGIETKV